MSSIEHKIDAAELMRGVTMTVTLRGLRVLRVRIWLASKLIALAALVAGCCVRMEDAE
jgi:hypothetical protein